MLKISYTSKEELIQTTRTETARAKRGHSGNPLRLILYITFWD
jgi:hypothetical protein